MSHLTSKYKSTPTYTFKSRNQSITSSNRDQTKPSPFHYQVNPLEMGKEIKPYGKFNKSSKLKDILRNDTKLPGPGAYESSSSIHLDSFNKGETLKKGQKRFYETVKLTPAPNQYTSIENNSKSLPKFSFTRANRSLSELEDSPSPDLYNPNLQIHQKSMQITIGNSKRQDNLLPTKSPGPGAYLKEKQFCSNTAFNQKKEILPKAKRMNSSQSLTLLPAPNSYKMQSFIDENQKKQKGFTCRKRYSSKQLNTPAPNLYDRTVFTNKYDVKVGFPKSQRSYLSAELKKSQSIPGPGSHQLESLNTLKFKSLSGSKFSSSKLSRLLQTNTPQHRFSFTNPQKLDVSKRSIPKYTIGQGKARQQEPKDRSVDKFYDTSYDKTIKSHNSFKIPHEKRMKAQKKSSIGPGYYNSEITTTFTRQIKFPKAQRKTFLDQAVEEKLKTFKEITHQSREQFPNPPKYMNVYKKIVINDQKIKQY